MAFAADRDAPPPLTLRGGAAVDAYDEAPPHDAALDAADDAYLERHAWFAMPYLDPWSWRHYLPRLIEYALHRPDDPAMAIEALVRSLRPPDRHPPRLATLDARQERCVVAFLEWLALDERAGVHEGLADDARQALDEWWLPNARHRTASPEPPAAPTAWREAGDGPYRLELPAGMGGDGARHIAEERRAVEVWRGGLAADPAAVVHVNVEPLDGATLRARAERAAAHVRHARIVPADVAGSSRAWRIEGEVHEYSPAEPQRIVLVVATAGGDAVTLGARWYPGAVADAAMERVVRSFRIVRGEAGA